MEAVMICIMYLCTSIDKTHLESKKRYWKLCWNSKIPYRIRTLKHTRELLPCSRCQSRTAVLVHWADSAARPCCLSQVCCYWQPPTTVCLDLRWISCTRQY